MTDRESKNKITDYISILIKWKRFILTVMIVLIISSTIISFLIPETFQATTTLMFPENNDFSQGAFSGLLSSVPFLNAGFAGGSANVDKMIGILKSRTVLLDVIKKFNLENYYGVSDGNIDLVLRAFRDDIRFEVNENYLLEISVIHQSPDTAAVMANYFAMKLDSLNRYFNVEEARNNRIFIERRYQEHLNKLSSLEDSLENFQQKYGIYAIPEQIEAAISMIADLEAQLAEKKLLADAIGSELDTDSPNYKLMLKEIELVENKINNLKKGQNLEFNSVVLFPFKKLPEMQKLYFQLFRDIEIQGKIIEFILPLYEKAKIDEQKSLPTVMVLDKAVPPQLKYAPKKAFIILAVSLFGFIILVFLSFRGESILTTETEKNIFENKEKGFYTKLVKIFRIKTT
ncbi:MAG: hypothetical protein Kow0098_11190 [Ignavibacteriaceae bacterium]